MELDPARDTRHSFPGVLKLTGQRRRPSKKRGRGHSVAWFPVGLALWSRKINSPGQ